MVKIPLDHVCVKSGVLCPRCQLLVDSGRVQSFEVDVMRALIELEESGLRNLKDTVYHKSYKEGDLLVIVMEFKAKISSHELARLAKNLSNKLGLKVKIVNKSGDVKQIAASLLYPARILGINTVWLPDGSTHYVIRIPRSDSRIIQNNKEMYERILSQIIGQEVEIRIGEI